MLRRCFFQQSFPACLPFLFFPAALGCLPPDVDYGHALLTGMACARHAHAHDVL
jgi:hypothetical protein